MTQPNILELAKQGDAKAIAAFLNQSLQKLTSTTAKVSCKDNYLKVVLESVHIPDQQVLVPFIRIEMSRLGIESITKVKVYGQQKMTFDAAWHQEFDLKEKVKPPLSDSAQSKSFNTKASSQVGCLQNRVSEAELRDALEQCSKTARKAYERAVEYAKQAESILQKLNTNLSMTTYLLLKNKDVERFEFTSLLKNILSELQQLSRKEIEELINSLDIKRKHLEYFTIALFGRTKAGKSTIREALTRGDGNTIGKGSQRTTRDVREYCWQGLRLLDTPGIEAYQGDEDTAKANQVIDQSDMILFLTSDDAVQPGEFSAMAQLQRMNKYFAVILNVKDNIEKTERFSRFIKRPEKVFDQQRLTEHQNHIRSYVTEHLKIENVDIVCIHALAAFLSTKPQYNADSQKLWELSRVEEVYYSIAFDIKINGQKRRASTFFEGAINFMVKIENQVLDYQYLLKDQIKFLQEKSKELERIFVLFHQESNLRIERECTALYSSIKQWIPYLVDNYSGKDEILREWEIKVNQKHIETPMNEVIDEIYLDLQGRLKEFNQQYQYDIKAIKIDLDELGINDINESQFGHFLRRSGVVIGGVAAVALVAANWWNPAGWVLAAGWITTGVGIVTGMAGEWTSEQETKEFHKQREDLKLFLFKKVEQKEQETIKVYKKWLHENLEMPFRKQTFGQVDTYIEGLTQIAESLSESHVDIQKLRKLIKTALCD